MHGVFFEADGRVLFRALPKPMVEDLERVAARIARQVRRWIEQHEHLDEPRDGLALTYPSAAQVGQRAGFDSPPLRLQRLAALVEGFSLEAGRHVHQHDRAGLERLCRYGCRPPLAVQRLSRGSDDQLVLRFKRPLADGSTEVRLSPMELMRRLATMVPPPGFHLVCYHGLFASRLKAGIGDLHISLDFTTGAGNFDAAVAFDKPFEEGGKSAVKTKKWSKGSVQSAFGAAALLFCTVALADNAPDATRRNSSVAVTFAEYRFAAAVDPDVAADRAIEIWARVTRPNPLPAIRSPLLVFLHGNHGTCGTGMNPRVDSSCQYTTSGTCPPGFVVTPNHAGYQYLADVLASHGYIVVSINANRGITCGGAVTGDFGLNLMRGRLVLKHLQFLSGWNSNPGSTPPSLGVDLFNRLDFDNVGLMGHSRGGEGMRAAYNLYRDLGSPWPFFIGPLNIVAIFEIGPVDGQTSRTLDPDGTIWNVLLPMCDGDVSNLEGVKPFDRALRIDEFPPTQKSTYTVWGANHNYYNTEWQTSDSSGCSGPGNTPLFSSPVGSPAQRTTGLASVNALFRGNIGPNAKPQFNRNFNPQYNTPFVVSSVTRVDRGFTNSPSSKETLVFEDFDGPTGTGQYGFPTTASNINITHGPVPNHAPVQRAGVISWTTAGDNRFFQSNWAAPGTGVDISFSSTLDLRLSRQNSGLNPVGPTNFAVALGLNDGTLSQTVDINSYTDLRGPVGGAGFNLHPILQTARIPLADFATDLTRVRSVRLIFNDTGSGAIFVANIRISASSGSPPAGAGSGPSAGSIILNDQYNPSPVVPEVISSARIQGIRSVSSSEALEGNPGVELEILSTDVPFLPQNDLPRLRVGDKVIVAPSYYPTGGIESIVFALSHDQYRQLQSGSVSVEYSSKVWNLGNIKL